MDILLLLIVLLLAYFLVTALHISLWTLLLVLAVIALIVYIQRR